MKDQSLVLYIDGASRGNPGRAGAGVWMTDGEGKKILEMARYLGYKTNNQAEYLALLLGLKEARRSGGESLLIFTDSELVERQIRGVYRVKDLKLKPLHRMVMKKLAGFSSFQIKSIPREENRVADGLANQAIERRIAAETGKEGTQRGAGGRSP